MDHMGAAEQAAFESRVRAAMPDYYPSGPGGSECDLCYVLVGNLSKHRQVAHGIEPPKPFDLTALDNAIDEVEEPLKILMDKKTQRELMDAVGAQCRFDFSRTTDRGPAFRDIPIEIVQTMQRFWAVVSGHEMPRTDTRLSETLEKCVCGDTIARDGWGRDVHYPALKRYDHDAKWDGVKVFE